MKEKDTKFLSNKGLESKETLQTKSASKSSVLQNIGKTSVAVASSGLFLGLMTKPEEVINQDNDTLENVIRSETSSLSAVSGELKIASSLSPELSFDETFAAARLQVGPGGYFPYHGGWYGTYYAEEWNSLTPAEKTAFSEAIFSHPHHEYAGGGGTFEGNIIIHEVAPVSTWVSDDMPNSDAHLIARIQVGPGGIFTLQGKTYSTYYPSELASMTEEQHQRFIDSVERADVSTEIHESEVNIGDVILVHVDTSNLFYNEEIFSNNDLIYSELQNEGLISSGNGIVLPSVDNDETAEINENPDVVVGEIAEIGENPDVVVGEMAEISEDPDVVVEEIAEEIAEIGEDPVTIVGETVDMNQVIEEVLSDIRAFGDDSDAIVGETAEINDDPDLIVGETAEINDDPEVIFGDRVENSEESAPIMNGTTHQAFPTDVSPDELLPDDDLSDDDLPVDNIPEDTFPNDSFIDDPLPDDTFATDDFDPNADVTLWT